MTQQDQYPPHQPWSAPPAQADPQPHQPWSAPPPPTGPLPHQPWPGPPVQASPQPQQPWSPPPAPPQPWPGDPSQQGHPHPPQPYPGQPYPQPGQQPPGQQPPGQQQPGQQQPGQQQPYPQQWPQDGTQPPQTHWAPAPPQTQWGPPPQPVATPMPGPAPRRKGLLPILLLVLLLLGGGAAFAVVEFGQGSSLSVAWTLKATGGGKTAGDGAADSTSWAWLVGDTVVRAQTNGVVAFRLADGKQAWTVPVPSGSTMCTAGRELADDRVVIVYGAEACDRMAVVEVRTGKLEREFPVPAYAASGSVRRIPAVAFGAGVAVIVTDRRTEFVKVSDGSKVLGMIPSPGCYFSMNVRLVGDQAVMVENCIGDTLVTRLPLTRKGHIWESTLTGVDTYGLVSADPPVLITSKNSGGWALTVLNNEDGKVRHELPTTIDGVKLDTGGGSALNPPLAFGMQVHQGTLYAETDVGSDAAELVAIDLATGRKRWASADHEHSLDLVRVDDQGVLALERGYESARLVRVDRGDGAVTVVASGKIPDDSLPVTPLLLEGGRTVVTIPRSSAAAREPIALSALRY